MVLDSICYYTYLAPWRLQELIFPSEDFVQTCILNSGQMLVVPTKDGKLSNPNF